MIPPISRLLPHASPMLLLDELLWVDGERACCQVRDPARLALFLTTEGRLPGWVGVELMAQSIAAWAGYQSWQRQQPPRIGLLLGCRHYLSHQPWLTVAAGLRIEVERLMQDGGLSSFECRLYQGDELVAEARLSTLEPTAQQMEQLLG